MTRGRTRQVERRSTGCCYRRSLERRATPAPWEGPFQGGELRRAAQVPAALGGQVDAAVAAIGTVASYVKDHKAIVLGVFGKSHWAVAPDIPTFKELGFDVTLPGSFGGIVAPRGTPAYIVTTLNEAIKQALAELSFVSFAEMRGSTIDYQGPKAFARELRRAYEENGELIRVLGLTQK